MFFFESRVDKDELFHKNLKIHQHKLEQCSAQSTRKLLILFGQLSVLNKTVSQVHDRAARRNQVVHVEQGFHLKLFINEVHEYLPRRLQEN